MVQGSSTLPSLHQSALAEWSFPTGAQIHMASPGQAHSVHPELQGAVRFQLQHARTVTWSEMQFLDAKVYPRGDR